MKAFLNRDTITSREIDEMMYEYSLFGNAMQTLFQYGATVYFDWKPNYDKMEILYKRFLRNEIMMEMLSSRGDIANPEIEGNVTITEEAGEGKQKREYIYEKPELTAEEKELDNNTKYDILAAKLEKLEGAIEEAEAWVEYVPDLTAALEEYRLQMEGGKCCI